MSQGNETFFQGSNSKTLWIPCVGTIMMNIKEHIPPAELVHIKIIFL